VLSGDALPPLVTENFQKFSQVETFRKLSLRRSRIDFYLLIFYRNIYVSGKFLPYYLCFFIVLSMFWETFRKFSSLTSVLHSLNQVRKEGLIHCFNFIVPDNCATNFPSKYHGKPKHMGSHHLMYKLHTIREVLCRVKQHFPSPLCNQPANT
jgi:hypothetical protein